ncbi:MAG: hypothetical protein Q7P63_01175 [Verrucomicrobiota bacterium JB022]|nr:hypothetical protein [Verrucomicrobiota bacterium JB022]
MKLFRRRQSQPKAQPEGFATSTHQLPNTSFSWADAAPAMQASSAYESANYSHRRARIPGAAPTDAKKELTSGTRSELVRKSRYL